MPVMLRELAHLAHSHAGTLARELDKLGRTGLLLRSEYGNQIRYQANTSHLLFGDLATMFLKTHGVVTTLQEALAPLDEQVQLALMFESMASGTASTGNDVDALVLGTVDFMELAQAVFPLQATLGREVNMVLYRPDEFATRLSAEDAFACDVMAKPELFVDGDAHELAELAGDRAAASPPG